MTIAPLLALAAIAGALSAGLIIGVVVAHRRWQILVALAILAATAVAVPLILELRPVAQPRGDLDRRPLVRVLTLTPRAVALAVEGQGSVHARGEHDLAAEVAGRVVWVAPELEPGGAFAAGAVLVRIAPETAAAAVVSARAALAQAMLAQAQEQAAAGQARREWERLGQGEAGALGRFEPQLAAVAARLAAAQSALAEAERDHQRTAITAVVAGRVRSRQVEVGTLLARGAVVARVHGEDAVDIPLAVSARDLDALALAGDFAEERAGVRGPVVELHPVASAASAGSGAAPVWTGRIVRASGAVDAATRQVTLIARVEQPFAGATPLLPGSFVAARIRGRTLPAALLVPRAALRDDGSVLTVDAAGLIQHRAVQVLALQGDDAVVAADLPAGERLCLTRLDEATPGTAVRVVAEGATGAEVTSAAPAAAPGRTPAGR